MVTKTNNIYRLVGKVLKGQAQFWHALRTIKGIGTTTSRKICQHFGIADLVKVKDLSDEQMAKIGSYIESHYQVETAVDLAKKRAIAHLKRIKCYRGWRHQSRLPVHGQSTHSNAKTAKRAAHLKESL